MSLALAGHAVGCSFVCLSLNLLKRSHAAAVSLPIRMEEVNGCQRLRFSSQNGTGGTEGLPSSRERVFASLIRKRTDQAAE
uniref:Putative secreted protein n=1 Tax=Anopheles darlingi TaxID=43151 RepID=A0A2M4DDL0_ANODA